MTNALEHIAIIMDGNGRWALKRGLPRTAGHQKGAETLIEICKAARKMGIKYMSVYAFSTENWKRPPTEVTFLMKLFGVYFDKYTNQLIEDGIRVKFIGNREMLNVDLVKKMNNLEQKTSMNTETTLLICLNYGARDEIIHAAQKIAMQVKNGDILPQSIDEKSFSDMLYTKNIPDPDILIRTSGEKRLSNFLLWQLAYTEFFFTDTLWPDFTEKELAQIIETYQTRERRYGKV